MMLKDISNANDVKLMVDSFYEKVNRDDLLAPIFNETAEIDWDNHLPIMYGFWRNVLFSTGEYAGRPFLKHAPLPISDAHFERWLALFNENLNDLFEGPKTEEARFRAKNIGAIFSAKMNQIQDFQKGK